MLLTIISIDLCEWGIFKICLFGHHLGCKITKGILYLFATGINWFLQIRIF